MSLSLYRNKIKNHKVSVKAQLLRRKIAEKRQIWNHENKEITYLAGNFTIKITAELQHMLKKAVYSEILVVTKLFVEWLFMEWFLWNDYFWDSADFLIWSGFAYYWDFFQFFPETSWPFQSYIGVLLSSNCCKSGYFILTLSPGFQFFGITNVFGKYMAILSYRENLAVS